MGVIKAWGTFSVSVFCREVRYFMCLLINLFVLKNYGNDS